MKTYLLAGIGAMLVSLLLTPLVARIAKRRGLLDEPGVRKVHKNAVPRIGGVAIFLGMLSVIVPIMALDGLLGDPFSRIVGQTLALLGASAFIFAVGLVDDLRSVPAKIKLLALVAASLVVCASGARIQGIEVDGLFDLSLGWASWPVTVLWIAGVTVGMNFIDGLDGLAAGISLIVCGTIAVLAWSGSQEVMAIMMVALMGSLVGFLFFNFNPAKIFMGDCGSMFLGFVIGAGSVVGQAKTNTLVGLALPMLALGVPIFDAVLTVVRRGVLDRRSIFSAERGHIHHRLIDMGFNHRRAVLLIYAVTLAAAGAGMFLLVTRSTGSLVVIAAVVLFLLLLFHWAGSTRIRETLVALQRNSQIKRQSKLDRGHFEHAQLAMREATSFDGWWNVMCEMARVMEFERLTWSLSDADGQRIYRVWQRRPGELQPADVATVALPLRSMGEITSRIEGSMSVAGTYETVGRRVMLLGRLIDERKGDDTFEAALDQRLSQTRLVSKHRARKHKEELAGVGA